MNASPSPSPSLEDRVRGALASRAHSTVIDVPESFTPDTVARHRRRRTLVLAAAAATVAVLGIAALAVQVGRDDDGVDTATDDVPEPGTRGTSVHGPTGSPWLVLDLPGLSPPRSDRVPTEPLAGGRPELQAFRTEAGFDGPMVWIEPGGGALRGSTAIDVTVGGRPAYAYRDGGGDIVTITMPQQDGVFVVAANLEVDEVVAFADGLQPRSGGGWEASVLPRGLAEVTEDAAPTPAAEHLELSYTGPDGANYELFVNPGGQAVFESWAREFAAGGGDVVALSVDGRPGVLFDAPEGETVAVWRPTDDTVADIRTNLDVEGTLAAMSALRPVDEADWPEG